MHTENSPLYRYHLTFDIDWAPDISIKKCLDKLCDFDVKATFFTTHYTDFNKEIVNQGHELGIHPNFLSGSTQGYSSEEILENCLKLAPSAKYIRTHGLYHSTPLMTEIFRSYPQLESDVSLFVRHHNHICKVPFNFEGVPFNRIMYNWEDDAEFFNSIDFTKPNFYGTNTVYNFHPIHIHLNSSNGSEYRALRSALVNKELHRATASEIEDKVNHSKGMADLLESILKSGATSFNLNQL